MMDCRIINDDCLSGLRTLPDASVHCCVTSPPYWGLRDYGHDGQIGLEQTPEEYVARMVEVFREVRRVLREDGTLWLNLGDSYSGAGPSGASYQSETTKRRAAGDGNDGVFRVSKTLAARGLSYAEKKPVPPPGLKPKDLVGIPWLVAFALRADGWWLRQDIIWHKPNPMPESVRDRCTKAHEYLFLLTKSQRYHYDTEAVKERSCGTGGGKGFGKVSMMDAANAAGQQCRRYERPDYRVVGRNRRSVWTIPPKPYKGAHFAVMPPDLVEPCVKAGTSERGCCPECGAPWERVVERTSANACGPRGDGGTESARAVRGQADRPLHGGSDWYENANSSTTTGWQPACTCPTHDAVPCTVLDPFAGSGTTLAVAVANRRSAIGIELNPDYIPLIERRIEGMRCRVPGSAAGKPNGRKT